MARKGMAVPRRGLRAERLAFLFVLGLLVFNPPFLAIYNLPETVFGIPLLYLYLFASWACLIALAALAIEGTAEAEDEPEPPPPAEPDL